ncbi:MAG: flavin monoamine oxidase family protein [Methylobacter sp.]
MPRNNRRLKRMLDVAIIGAGLSGLSLAERLFDGKRNIAVFEARDRCGGRILSHSIISASDSAFEVDLGPTWLWPGHQPRITALAKRLGLELFRQWDRGHSLYQIDRDTAPLMFMDPEPPDTAAWRIKGGCRQLTDGLLQRLPDSVVHLQHRLLKLTDRESYVELEFATGNAQAIYRARQVVLAIPPRLLADSVVFEPELALKFVRVMQDTPTWMAGHAKAMLVYQTAFWRGLGYSGNALLPYPGAVLAEVHDACSEPDGAAALFGFFGLSTVTRERYHDNLEALVVQQITGLFGSAAANPLQVIVQDWSLEMFTATQHDHAPLTGHPVYGQRSLCLDHWQDKLYFCGTETAQEAGGYLEGALEASERVFAAIS